MVKKIDWKGGSARLYIYRLPPDFCSCNDILREFSVGEQKHLYSKEVYSSKSKRSLVAKCYLRLMLSEILGIISTEVKFIVDNKGRPCLHPCYGLSRDVLDFSVSHIKEGFVICLAHGHRVGVDIQRFTSRQKENFYSLFGDSSTDEYGLGLSPHQIWTRMEAHGKMRGDGLEYGMQKLYAVALAPGKSVSPCCFYDFCVGKDVSVALCLSGCPKQPVFLEGSRLD